MRDKNTSSVARLCVVIRHDSALEQYHIEYGWSEGGALRSGPRFRDLEQAIAWTEKFDRRALMKGGRAPIGGRGP